MTTTALVLLIVAGILIGSVLGYAASVYLRRASRRLRIMALVLRRAAKWGEAEEALRERQTNGKWSDPYYNLFSEENHRVALRSDVTEQLLLDATRSAKKEGLDLRALGVLS